MRGFFLALFIVFGCCVGKSAAQTSYDFCAPLDVSVFFESDLINLTPEALELIDTLANLVQRRTDRECELARVSVVGGTDRTYDVEHSYQLSRQQARVIVDALIARGIPEAAIESEARGEEFVPHRTGDSVSEPVNRAASILVEFRSR